MSGVSQTKTWRQSASATARTFADRDTSFVPLRRTLVISLAAVLLIWVAIVVGRGILLALRTFGSPVVSDPLPNYATTQMLWAAGLVYLLCLLTAMIVRRFKPAATLPVTLAAGLVIFLAAAISTSTLGSVLIAFALFVIIWLVGDMLLRSVSPSANMPFARLPIAVGLGLGVLGLLLLALSFFGLITMPTILVVSGAILAFAATRERERLRSDLRHVLVHRFSPPSWFETVVIGMGVGLLTFALLSTLVPEDQSDAIRQHLPIAREIWQTGTAPAFPGLSISRSPIEAHLFFAVAYGLGGVTAAKLVHTFAGLIAIAGIAAIGGLCAGRVAALVGAVVFGTMPIVLWELGHAYTDLFPILFTVAAVLCVLLWQRDGALSWLICAGALASFGFAAKLTMLWMVAAIGAALFLVGKAPWSWRDRLQAAVVFGLGTLVVIPWLARSYEVTGTLPGFGDAIAQLGRLVPQLHVPAPSTTSPAPGIAPSVNELTISDSDALAGRSPLDMHRSLPDLLTVPWDLTFRGEVYHSQGAGDIGVLQLMLLPLTLFAPRTRATAFLALTVIFSYVAWWLSPQVTRHLLPTLALTAALIGSGVANLAAFEGPRARRIVATGARAAVLLGCLAVPFLYLPNWKTTLPVDLLLGRETAAEYIAADISSAGALLAAGDQLPADKSVGYFGVWEGPQLYTESRLYYLNGQALGKTAADILHQLDYMVIRFLVWNRPESRLDDWRSTVLSTAFLREHSRILVGDRNTYVINILPDAGLTWGEKDPPQLLQDPELEKVGRKGDAWTAEGKVKPEGGGVPLRPRSALTQQVPVTPGRAYVLTATSSCPKPDDGAQLTLRWLDAQGAELDAVSETVIPGTEPSEQFIWRRAPQGAAKVSAEVTTARGGEGATCTFDAVSLVELS